MNRVAINEDLECNQWGELWRRDEEAAVLDISLRYSFGIQVKTSYRQLDTNEEAQRKVW